MPRKPKRTKAKPAKLATSARHLARLMGVSESLVRKWRKRPDWPFGQKPPWNPTKVEAWRQRTLTQTPGEHLRQPRDSPPVPVAATGDLHRASVAYKLERTLLLRQERLEREGKMHDVAECQQRRLAQISAVRSALLDLPRSLPIRLAGRPVDEMGPIIEEVVYAILNEFAGREQING